MSVELIFTVLLMGFIGFKITGFLIDKIKDKNSLSNENEDNNNQNSGKREADQDASFFDEK